MFDSRGAIIAMRMSFSQIFINRRLDLLNVSYNLSVSANISRYLMLMSRET